MVSVFFHCSCPYIGFQIKKVDYANRQLIPCSGSERYELGKVCHKVFTSSGSHDFLGNLEGKRYFHTRSSTTQIFDENNRPIYNDMAFVGETPDDFKMINKICAYSFFEEEAFYEEILGMITLTRNGFEVDFDKFVPFLKRFEGELIIDAKNNRAKDIYENAFIKDNSNEICVIVPETSIANFFRQVEITLDCKQAKIFTVSEKKELQSLLNITFSQSEPSAVALPLVPVNDENHYEEPVSEKTVENLKAEIAQVKEDMCKKSEDFNAMISELRAEMHEDIKAEVREELKKASSDKKLLLKNIIVGIVSAAATVLVTLVIQNQFIGG